VQLASSFVAALIAISALLVLLLLATTARKALRAARDRRQARIEAEVRPLLLSFLAADEPDPAALAITSRAAGRSIEELAAGLLTKFRGEDRRVLADLLASQGVIERARARTRLPGAVGRARAAELLGAAGEPAAVPELERLLSDRDPDVRSAAARALGKLGGAEAVPALLASLEGRRPVPAGIVTMALLHIGPAACEPLHEGLAEEYSPEVRAIAAELLGRLGAFGAADDLVQVMRADGSAAVRAAAAQALGRIGAPRAIAQLEAALIEDGTPAVQQAAAWALGELGGVRGFAGLARALGSGRHALARAAAEALPACGPSGLNLLELTLAEDRAGAAEARETLGRLAMGASR
jgi:HEAT repeat protein